MVSVVKFYLKILLQGKIAKPDTIHSGVILLVI